MKAAWWRSPQVLGLLARRATRAVAIAHVGGGTLLALALAVDVAARGADALFARLLQEGPPLWGALAGILSLFGAALGVARMRGDRSLLALSTLGVPPAAAFLVAAVLGAGLGGLAATVPVRPPPLSAPGWTRAEGGWVDPGGVAWPDVAGGAVRPITSAPALRTSRVFDGGAAGLAGAALGAVAGVPAVLVVGAGWIVGDALAEGLYARGGAGAWVLYAPGALGVLGAWLRYRRGS